MTATSHAEPTPNGGFTLIELLVVVAILGVLVAIAVPKFISSQTTAKIAAAQSNLRAAESLATSVAARNGGAWSTGTIAADLAASDKALTWAVGESTGPKVIGFDLDPTGNILTLAGRSDSGDCYRTRIDSTTNGGTYYLHTTAASCDASAALTYTATSNDVGWA